LQTPFEHLIDSFIENKIGIAENFLASKLASNLKANLMALYSSQQLRSAGTGNELLVSRDKGIRSDKIYWLDRTHNDTFENSFFDIIDQFILFLNSTCYTGITGYEFHYTLYEAGTFYKKHIDQFRNDKSRAYSMIMYLNAAWKEGDGGELCVYHSNSLQTISPLHGKCVFFKSSETEHEVLITHQPRLSITGWLKCD
jgi:SM-20-related protein